MELVSKVLSAIGIRESSTRDSTDTDESPTDETQSESQAFGEKSMDDLLGVEEDSE